MTISEAAEKYDVPAADIVEPAVLIKVNRTYRSGMNAEELYEATRGNWVIGTRRNNARYAFAVYKGIILEAYEIERWYPAEARLAEQKRKERWAFDGKIAAHLSHYIDCSTVNYSVHGAQNPIQYVNC